MITRVPVRSPPRRIVTWWSRTFSGGRRRLEALDLRLGGPHPGRERVAAHRRPAAVLDERRLHLLALLLPAAVLLVDARRRASRASCHVANEPPCTHAVRPSRVTTRLATAARSWRSWLMSRIVFGQACSASSSHSLPGTSR